MLKMSLTGSVKIILLFENHLTLFLFKVWGGRQKMLVQPRMLILSLIKRINH